MSSQPVVGNAELASGIEPDVLTFDPTHSDDIRDRKNKSILINSVDKDQFPVTRKELWSYYCEYHRMSRTQKLIL